MELYQAMQQRRSVRAYLKRIPTRKDIEEIFHYAGRAPSAINLQPWEYVVTYGEEKDRLCRRLKKVHAERQVTCGPGSKERLPEKFTARSRAASAVMAPKVEELGLAFKQFVEQGSCSFYGAPLAIIVTIDKRFPHIRYLDLGLSVAYFLLAAEAKGLGTCPIGLIEAYGSDIAEVLNIPEEKTVVLGIAMGYADETSPINRFVTDRDEQSSILSWYE